MRVDCSAIERPIGSVEPRRDQLWTGVHTFGFARACEGIGFGRIASGRRHTRLRPDAGIHPSPSSMMR